MKLLLADDHVLFRDALVQFIARADPDATVLLAQDMHGVVDIMENGDAVDLVLLDMRMPGMEGLEGLAKFRARWPETPVALLSGLAERRHVERAMDLGAAGYIPKTLSGRAMLTGIRDMLGGKRYVAIDHNTGGIMPSYYAADSAPDMTDAQADDAFPALSPREGDVLERLLEGESNREIARALGLQVVTVKLHLRSICRKLGAKNRTQAALIAQKHKLGQSIPGTGERSA